MKIGLFYGAAPSDNVELNAVIAEAVQAEADGLDSFWMPHIFWSGTDTMTTLALIGAQTERIALGTGVITTYLRHPVAMAQQAITVQVATNGRLTLGVGPAHKPAIEDVLGLSYDRPAKHTREYLSVLNSLITDGKVDFDGEFFNVHTAFVIPDAMPVPVMISALAPLMLRLAGSTTDGTITWMAGLSAIETHVAPRINAAAAAADRPAPRIVVALPVAVTDDEHAGHQQAAELFGRYGTLANYRRILDVEDVDGPAAVALVGSEAEVERQLRAFADAGTTEFIASVFPVGDDPAASTARTKALLSEVASR